MGFIARIFSPPSPPPAPAPVAPPPVLAPVSDPAGDRRDRLRQQRGGAGARRGSTTVLTGGDESGATAGKTLLGE